VRRLEVFGSAAHGVDFDPAASNADSLVTFEESGEEPGGGPSFKTQMDLAEALRGVPGRRVDLARRGAVEKSRSYIRRRGILAEAQIVHG
jgi:predicted nucleotidyltransferase